MKRNITRIQAAIAGAILLLASQAGAEITTPNGSTLFTPLTDLSAGGQNGHVGMVGGKFLTSYNDWPGVNWLGYYDKDGDGLANSHQVGLWADDGTLLASATIAAGTEAPLWNGYRWAQVTTVGLWYNGWYTLAGQTDGVDTWGDLISADAGQISWGEEFTNLDSGYEFSRQGRYGDAWGMPVNASGNNAIYPAVNLGYNLPIVVPEPGSLALVALGAVALFTRRIRL